MIKVGVTGGIGSGKSAVCRVWESLGAKVVYADDLAKDLMTNDDKLRDAIKSIFGNSAYDEKGKLNRSYLAMEAFNKGRVQELNNLVHPRVKEEVNRLALAAAEEGYSMFVEEAALLLNEGRPGHLDVIVLVEASEKHRLNRVKARDKVDLEQIQARIQRQQDPKQLRIFADYILVNDGSMDELTERSKTLYHKLLLIKTPK